MKFKEHIEKWDRGEIISTLEMGGVSPGYEQAIQLLVAEILRETLAIEGAELTNDQIEAFCMKANERMTYGVSGAQAGAAKWCVRNAWDKGSWDAFLDWCREECENRGEKDRIILTSSRDFPTVKQLEARDE